MVWGWWRVREVLGRVSHGVSFVRKVHDDCVCSFLVGF